MFVTVIGEEKVSLKKENLMKMDAGFRSCQDRWDHILDDGDDGWLTENRDLWCQNRKFEGGFVEVKGSLQDQRIQALGSERGIRVWRGFQ